GDQRRLVRAEALPARRPRVPDGGSDEAELLGDRARRLARALARRHQQHTVDAAELEVLEQPAEVEPEPAAPERRVEPEPHVLAGPAIRLDGLVVDTARELAAHP